MLFLGFGSTLSRVDEVSGEWCCYQGRESSTKVGSGLFVKVDDSDNPPWRLKSLRRTAGNQSLPPAGQTHGSTTTCLGEQSDRSRLVFT